MGHQPLPETGTRRCVTRSAWFPTRVLDDNDQKCWIWADQYIEIQEVVELYFWEPEVAGARIVRDWQVVEKYKKPNCIPQYKYQYRILTQQQGQLTWYEVERKRTDYFHQAVYRDCPWVGLREAWIDGKRVQSSDTVFRFVKKEHAKETINYLISRAKPRMRCPPIAPIETIDIEGYP